MMLTLEVAGILGLIGIRDVRRVFLWLVEYLTLAGPCPFLLVLVSHCPGWVRFFEILVFISLLSSISVDNSSSYCGQGGLGVFMFFFFFYFLFLVSRFLLGWITCIHLR